MARGKLNKTRRGGGHQFSREILEAPSRPPQERRAMASTSRRGEEGSSEESSSSSSSESEKKPDPLNPKLGKKKDSSSSEEESSEEEDEEIKPNPELPQNPNRAKGKAAASTTTEDANRELSRREREALDKQKAKENYWKLHEQGKTDQARADLARLAEIKRQREAAAKQREAERKLKEEAAISKQVSSNKKSK